jgi:RimJ/RimL family protein N-acetyltransferase
LQPGDEDRLDHFLRQHADSSLFLRSNSLAAGLLDEGKPLQATYVARVDGDVIVGVVAHGWNGNLLLQAPVGLAEILRHAVATSGRLIAGVLGPWGQVVAALTDLGLLDAATSIRSREDLFGLDLGELQVPKPLALGTLACRRSMPEDIKLLADWRRSYRMETLGELDQPELLVSSRDDIARSHRSGSLFVLVEEQRPVSMCAFNARHPDCVQIGGVWTPPQWRSRGYGRAVVAGALLIARTEGVTRSVLFTDEGNLAAQAAYVSLGYQRIGDYGLVLFRQAQRPPSVQETAGPQH